MKEVPIWEKSNLTLEEAAAYSGIGINNLRQITNDERCQFVFGWVPSGLSSAKGWISIWKAPIPSDAES